MENSVLYSNISNGKTDVGQLQRQFSELTSKLQSLLDDQGQSLLQGSSRRQLNKCRQGIRRTMILLMQNQTELSDYYQRQLNERTDWLEKFDQVQDKRSKVSDKMFEIETSMLGQQVTELRSQRQDVDHQIDQLEVTLANLRRKRASLAAELVRTESEYDSKLSSYKSELSWLDNMEKSLVVQLPETAGSNGTVSSSSGSPSAAAEICKRQLEAIETYKNEASKQTTALQDGITLWQHVCDIVLQTESTLKELTSGSDKDWTRILKMLNDKLQQLNESLQQARKSGWSLLDVAISQEIKAIEIGIEEVENLAEPEQSAAQDDK